MQSQCRAMIDSSSVETKADLALIASKDGKLQ